MIRAGHSVPVACVGAGSFFAVEIGVDSHGVAGFELVDEGMGAGPVSLLEHDVMSGEFQMQLPGQEIGNPIWSGSKL